MVLPDIFEDSSSLHRAAANCFLKVYQSSVQSQGAFHVALSGGTTPKHLYQLLAKSPYVDKIDWSKVHVYFGDERFVPQTHEDSNFKMASQTLLQHVQLPTDHIHSVATHLPNAQSAADDYQTQLTQHLPGNAQFDLVLLGLGPDGHTASLFPDTDILQQHNRLCDAVYVEKFDSWRISITYPAINHAKHILLLSEGKGKANIIQELVSTKPVKPQYPVQAIRPENTMHWYIDQAAAHLL